LDSIAATERGLTGITRSLNDQEQKTAAQIKEWLKQAHSALDSGDVDGAHTLAAKAKALLTELNQ
jgi:phosphoribosylformimino-5-aminoimidazole carboxamide ribonucleotide (ProFAR) isomerase